MSPGDTGGMTRAGGEECDTGGRIGNSRFQIPVLKYSHAINSAGLPSTQVSHNSGGNPGALKNYD